MTPKALSAEELDGVIEQVTLILGGTAGQMLRAHIAALEADNAYLLRMLSDYGVYAAHEATCAGRTGPSCDCPGGQPHPGAAMLERHEKEVAELTLARDMLAAMHEAAQKERLEERSRWTAEMKEQQTEFRKVLVRARNEGLESVAIALLEKRDAISTPYAKQGTRRAGLEEAASIARVMKEPEQ